MGEIADDLRRQSEDERRFKLNTANDLQIEPDIAERVFAVSAKTDLPDEVVAADLPNLEKQLKLNEFDADNYKDEVNGAPVFNQFAVEHPYHPAVLERDRKNMTRLERSWHALKMSNMAGWATTEISDIIERQESGDRREGDAAELKALRQIVEGGHFGAKGGWKFFTGLAKQAPIQGWILKESLPEMMIGGAGGTAVGAAYGATTLNPVGVAAGGVGGFFKGIGAGYLAGRVEAAGRLEGNLFLDQATELGMDPVQARQMAMVHRVIAGPLEAIGLGAITKHMPGFRHIQRDVTGRIVAQMFSQPSFKAALGRATAAYGEAFVTEQITEFGQTLSENIAMEHLKAEARAAGDIRPETEPMTEEQWVESIKETAIETMYGVGLMAGIGPSSQLYRESQQAYQAERLQHVWKAMGEAAKDNKLRETAPTKHEEFVNALTDYGQNENVLIEAEQFRTYFQEQGIDPNEVADSLGLDPAEVEEAMTLGLSMEIPVGPYLKVLAATEHHQGLQPHLKTDTVPMSAAEAANFRKNNPELMERMEKVPSGDEQVDTSVDTQYREDVIGMLVAAGTDPEAAQTQATVMAGIPNIGRKFYKDPMKVIDRLLDVRRAREIDLEKIDVDTVLDPLLDNLRENTGPTQKELLGTTLPEFLKERGGVQDQGGELSARDLQEISGLVTKDGLTLDGAAELAAKAGYIAEGDFNMLLEALDRGAEAPGIGASPAAVETQALLDRLEESLGMAGIDLNEITDNAVVRAKLEAMDTQFQEIADVQDFGDLTITEDKIMQGTGQTVKVSQAASTKFDRAVKRRNVAKQLMDCISA